MPDDVAKLLQLTVDDDFFLALCENAEDQRQRDLP